MKRLTMTVLMLVMAMSLGPSPIRAASDSPAMIFVETGFAVTDSAMGDFLTEFKRLGGLEALGFPISKPYTVDGFNYQAFQRAILQWRPELGIAVLANIFDWLSDRNKDQWLDEQGIPKPQPDSGGGWEQVVAERESWLTEPAIAGTYRSGGAMERFGLPQGKPERRGPFVVQRFQRIAFQLWVDQVPGMPAPGSVVGVLGGDLVKRAGGLIPPEATSPDTSQPSKLAQPADWLARVNFYRALAKLPAVTENPTWSEWAEKHAYYIVKTDVMSHDEDPTNPYYTPEGRMAAQTGNVWATSDVNFTDQQAIDSWVSGPFHAIGIVDPALLQTGYGAYREDDGDTQGGAVLNVLNGRRTAPASVSFPVAWPGDGATVPLRSFFSGENPNPLTSCPGYQAPVGLPILLILGANGPVPSVTAYSLSQDGTPLESCVFDETNYRNPDAAAQQQGRAVLSYGRHAIVLIPKHELISGATYTASITTNGRTYTWSFSVS